MAKKNYAKKALISSLLALFICFTMLIGTTFAWFTDSAVSANNIIKSGTLDVEMSYKEKLSDNEWIDASTGAIFNYDLWEPGYVQVRHIKIENKGNLALQYQISIAPNGEVSKLADVIDVYYVDPAMDVADRTALTDDYKLGTLTEAIAGMATTAAGYLVPAEKAGDGFNSEETITIALKMQEDAGNEYQNLEIGTDFAVQLVATQYTYESDSFDDQYDKDAVYPGVVSTPEDLGSAFGTEDEIKLGTDIELTDTVAGKYAYLFAEDAGNITLNLNGQKLTAANRTDAALRVKANTTLTITGNGEIEFGYALATIQDGATVIIENGRFHRDADANCEDDNTAFVKSGAKGTVIINGGYFDLSTKDGDDCRWGDHMEYPVDGSDLNLTINGGQFVDWNPSANVAAGANVTFEVVEGSTVYTVTAAN